MAERLAGGNEAIALLGNTIPTGAILVVIIVLFGPVSGAHFNPAVTIAFLARREIHGGFGARLYCHSDRWRSDGHLGRPPDVR